VICIVHTTRVGRIGGRKQLNVQTAATDSTTCVGHAIYIEACTTRVGLYSCTDDVSRSLHVTLVGLYNRFAS
jgi:hypothetical protein